MFKFRSIPANFLALGLFLALLVPVFTVAGPFASDPELVVYPDNEVLSFATTEVDSIETMQFVIENNSEFRKEIEISRRPSAPFTYDSSARFEIMPFSTRALTVNFEPTSTGSFTNTMLIKSVHTGETKTLRVSGNAVAKSSVDLGVTLSHTQFIFSNTLVGQVADGRIFITNKGLSSKRVSISEPSAPFELLSPDSFNIAKGEVKEIRVRFTPTSERNYSSDLNLTVGNTRYKIVLKGEGEDIVYPRTNLKNPYLTISGNPNGFAFTAVDTEKEIKLTNSGEKDLELEIVDSPDRPFRAYFRSEGNTEKVLSPGASTLLRVSFEPTKPGVYNSTFVLKSNSTNMPTRTFYVSGSTGSTVVARPIAPVYPSYAKDVTTLSVTRPEFNPDLGEVAYFNFNLASRSSLEIVIVNNKTNSVVYSKNYNDVSSGKTFLKYFWNGRNRSGDKVSVGTYSYFVTVDPYGNYPVRKFEGTLKVTRDRSHLTQPTNVYFPTPAANCGYGKYCPNTKTVIDESLVNKLRVNQPVITKFASTLYISFETSMDSKVSANILDVNKRLVKPLTKGRPMRDGFNNNLISWDTTVNGVAVPNGIYFVELFADSGTLSDADIVTFTIDRKPVEKDILKNYYPRVTPKKIVQPKVSVDICGDFVDVEASNEALCDAIIEAVNSGILKGDDKQVVRTFRPDDYITRVEAISIIVRALGLEMYKYDPNIDGNFGYKDLDVNSWYAPYVKSILKEAVAKDTSLGLWAKTIISAYPDGTLRPDQNMTRAEFYRLFLEALRNSSTFTANFDINYKVKNAPFADTLIAKNTAWFMPYADFARKNLTQTDFASKYFGAYDLSKSSAKFKPFKGVTRAEVAQLMFELNKQELVK